MNTQRFAGMIGLLAVVTLGVIGVDRWTKDAKAKQPITQTVSAAEPKPAVPPITNSTIHFQVDPGETPLPPVTLPKESAPPPVISTVEMEKQLKQSIDDLQRVLPKLAGGEEASALPPAPTPSLPEPGKVSAPEPKGLPDVKPAPKEDTERPAVPLPPVTNNTLPPTTEPLKEPTQSGPSGFTIPSAPNQDSPKPLAPSITAPVIPPVGTPKIQEVGGFIADVPPPPNPADRVIKSHDTRIVPATNVTATIASPQDFQKRLAELEIKYLKDMVAELEQRMKAMPQGEARQKLEMDHQRGSERLSRLIRAVEWDTSRKMDGMAGKMMDSPWTMHMETIDGKTVLQATVHRKARFKIICDRLDLQTPHGTLLAVGHVQISGEGFMGGCDRLSIPLHDDRLVLEGGAEVSVRARPSAIIETNKEGQPPIVEPRRLDEQASSVVPTLHLKGDHLDLRWLDVAPAATLESTKADDPQRPIIRGTPGPMVKVAFNSPANERWSEWGVLVAMPVEPSQKNAARQYVIQTREGQILAFVRAPANMALSEYIGKRVSVFGQPMREDGRNVMTYSVSHVAWE